VERTLFYLFAGTAVAASLWMVTRRNPLSSALSLVVAFLSLAGLYALLEAHLLFAIQLWVYAGAVMVLVLFVIMLLNLREEETRPRPLGAGRFALGALVVLTAGWKALAVLGRVEAEPASVGPGFGTVAGVSEVLFTRWVLQFEIVSILLMAVIAAVVRRGAGQAPPVSRARGSRVRGRPRAAESRSRWWV
jgi:NADH-quinone oxidoreductase subunit J